MDGQTAKETEAMTEVTKKEYIKKLASFSAQRKGDGKYEKVVVS